MTQFENLGFFLEYQVKNKLIGTKNVSENPSGKIGWESTTEKIAEADINFVNYAGKHKARIKKGTHYKTRIYPLCGRIIKE